MNYRFIIFFLFCIKMYAQQTGTKTLLRNVPIDKSEKELNDFLHSDNANYKTQISKAGHPYYIATTNVDSFFNLIPLILNFETDTTEIHMNITFNRNKNSSKNASITYQKIIDLVKNDYTYYKQEYFKQKYTLQSSTFFFINKEDTKYKLSVTWFDSGKYGHEFIIEYILE